MKTFLGCLLALVLTPFPAHSQEGQVPYIETLDVRVHSIEVIVVDDRGKPVTGLVQSDFEVLSDGAVQPITNFSAFAGTDPAVTAIEPAEGLSADDTNTRPVRKFIFFVDEMSMTADTQKRLQVQIEHLLDTAMEPGDEAMVLRPAEEKKLATLFTSDREVVRKTLLDAIARDRWRADAPIHRELRQLEIWMRGVDSKRARRLAARRWAGFVRKRVQQRLGQLQAVVNATAEIEGRKVLVLITESLPLEPGKEAFLDVLDPMPASAGDPSAAFWDWNVSDIAAVDWVDLTPLVNEIALSAATNGLTVYSVQAEYGKTAPGGDIGASRAWGRYGPASRTNASVSLISGGVPMRMVTGMINNTSGTLQTLAEKTGGRAYVGAGTFDNLVNGISSDVQNYYSIGIRAGEAVDQPRRIEVRVKGNPRLHVRTRQEIIRKSPEREMTDRVVARLFSQNPATNELVIHIEPELIGRAADRSYQTYHVAVHVPLSSLTFLPDGDVYKAKFSVHYAAMGADADFVSGMGGSQVVEVPAAEFAEAQSKRFTYVIPLNLRKSKHTIVMGVLDSLSRLSGFERTEVVVN